jgi:ribosomal protein L11 methyltransferase
MDWIELSTKAEAEAVDSVVEILSPLSHGGVAIEEPLTESSEPGRVEIDLTRPVTVKCYLPDDGKSEDKVARAEEALWHLSLLRSIEPLKVTRVAEEDWAEAWKEFFHVQHIGKRLIIKPTWREYQAAPDEVVIELDPGMAFGTGLHPTTRMCLEACERLVKKDLRVLDVGTGSGILSLAAVGLGARSALALEVDPVAVEVARKNVALNRLEERIHVYHGSLELLREPGASEGGIPLQERPEGGFDLVLANIIASVIAELAPYLRDAVAPDGVLVASGIIDEREGLVRDALAGAGMSVVETVSEGDWRTLLCEHGRP